MKIKPEGQIEHRRGGTESTALGPLSERQGEQYSLAKILVIWAAAALPMATLAWVVAPWLAGLLGGPVALPRVLIGLLTAGLVWQPRSGPGSRRKPGGSRFA